MLLRRLQFLASCRAHAKLKTTAALRTCSSGHRTRMQMQP